MTPFTPHNDPRGTPFARWDSRLFTPLCLAIALGSGIVALPQDTTTEERG